LGWPGPDPCLRLGRAGMGVFRRVAVDWLVDPGLESRHRPSGAWHRRQASFSPQRHGDREQQEFWREVRQRLIIHRAKRHRFPSPCLCASVVKTCLRKDQPPGPISLLSRPCRMTLRECRKACGEPIREHPPAADEITDHSRFETNSGWTLRRALSHPHGLFQELSHNAGAGLPACPEQARAVCKRAGPTRAWRPYGVE
jgi:hypothetical protein